MTCTDLEFRGLWHRADCCRDCHQAQEPCGSLRALSGAYGEELEVCCAWLGRGMSFLAWRL